MSGEEEGLCITEDDRIEDSPQDWGSINRPSDCSFSKGVSARLHDESLPRRSDKFFDQDGSHTLSSSLDSAREQMYLALSYMRGHHTKHRLLAVWIQSQNRAFIPHAKGGFFKDMGSPHVYKQKKRMQGMWLTITETLYLTERGSLILCLANEAFLQFMVDGALFFEYETLKSFTLAHLYATALSHNPQELVCYKVYSLLKRLGYSVMDHSEHEKKFAVSRFPSTSHEKSFRSLKPKIHTLFVNIGTFTRSLCYSFLSKHGHYFNFTNVFKSLAISHYKHKLSKPPFTMDPRYRLKFNVWKPSSSFSKKTPPKPDFQLGIVDTSTMPFPCLSLIEEAWDQLESGLKDAPMRNDKAYKNRFGTKKKMTNQRKKNRQATLAPEFRDRNNYLRSKDKLLKQGSEGRSIIFAIVNDGVVNFASLGKTDFELKSCKDSLNELERRDNHGIVWSEKVNL